MDRILNIAHKDLLQLLRDKMTFLFLLIMPIVFTIMLGFAFGGFNKNSSDSRIAVGFLDEDKSTISRRLHDLLADSEIIRLEDQIGQTRIGLVSRVSDEKIAAAIIVPARYGHQSLRGKRAKLLLIGNMGTSTGTVIKSEVLTSTIRMESAVRMALVFEQVVGNQIGFEYILEEALKKWQNPPISVEETTSTAINKEDSASSSLAHTSPGMMLQFAIAGLLTCAQINVSERKSRALQRILTTATLRLHILFGHFLAIFVLIFAQFLILILFGQFVLKVNYLRVPFATLLVAFSASLFVAALGLLIGIIAQNEDQAITFSLVPMFVFAALGGAWVPLEITGPVFQMIGHISPIAWGMDGFKNIIIRGFGFESALLPATALFGYGVLFFSLAWWRFRIE